LQGVKRELDDGADPLFADAEGFTVLHMAAQARRAQHGCCWRA